MDKIQQLEKFVTPFYKIRDPMHGLPHVRRVLKLAQRIAKNYKVNEDLIIYGSYFHGIFEDLENKLREFSNKQNLQLKIRKIKQVVKESQKEFEPKSIEGKILHDAHLLEGGRTFMIVKSLITGSIKDQNLEKTIEYIEKNVMGKFKCYLPECIELYKEKENFTKKFIEDLRKNL